MSRFQHQSSTYMVSRRMLLTQGQHMNDVWRSKMLNTSHSIDIATQLYSEANQFSRRFPRTSLAGIRRHYVHIVRTRKLYNTAILLISRDLFRLPRLVIKTPVLTTLRCRFGSITFKTINTWKYTLTLEHLLIIGVGLV